MTATLYVLNNLNQLSKLEQYRARHAKEVKAIRLRLTLAIIEEILKDG